VNINIVKVQYQPID